MSDRSPTQRYDNRMDPDCVALCDNLNALPGITTFGSCCGHGQHRFLVWFFAEETQHLAPILQALDHEWHVELSHADLPNRVVFRLEGPARAEAGDELAPYVQSRSEASAQNTNTPCDGKSWCSRYCKTTHGCRHAQANIEAGNPGINHLGAGDPPHAIQALCEISAPLCSGRTTARRGQTPPPFRFEAHRQNRQRSDQCGHCLGLGVMTEKKHLLPRHPPEVPVGRCCWVCGTPGGAGFTRALINAGYDVPPGEQAHGHPPCMSDAMRQAARRNDG